MEDLISKFQNHIDLGLCPGIEWKINYKGNIFQGKAGYLDISKKLPIQKNSIYRIWSMTKPIVSVVVLQLIEDSLIKIDDPLNLYLPEFNNLKVLKNKFTSINDITPVNKMPTIKDLLLHTAGFSYNFLNDVVGKEYEKIKLFHSENSTLEEEIKNLSNLPLLIEPSKEWNYSVSTDVLARILEVVLNDNLQNILEKKIFSPLTMHDTGFAITEKNQKRLMTSYGYDLTKKKLTHPNDHLINSYSYPLNNKKYARGGHGLYSSLEDYFKFSEMLLTGKSKTGEMILSEKMLKLATSNILDDNYFPLKIAIPGRENEENDLEPYGWGLGFRVLLNKEKSNNIGSLGEFGWSGAAATYFLVDPKNNLTALLMTQVLGAMEDLKNDFRQVIYSNLN